MSKPTMQDIADALSTSRISVWKALNNRPGVSDALRRQVQEKAAELGYTHRAEKASAVSEPHSPARTVAVAVSRPESSLFWMQIIHQMAKELSVQGINLMYTYLPAAYKEGYALPGCLSDGSVEGMVVLNVYSPQTLRLLAALPLPKVYLDTIPAIPFEKLNGDVVLISGRNQVRRITGRLLDSGRRRLGFIGDVEYAQTNLARYQGFLDAHSDHGVPVDPARCLTGPLGLRTHYEEISRFLDELPEMPDGFVCVSDYIAHFVQTYFDERGIAPGSVVLTGFDNSVEYPNVAGRITTADVEPRTLGARLANKLLFSIAHPGISPEVAYSTANVIFRGPLA